MPTPRLQTWLLLLLALVGLVATCTVTVDRRTRAALDGAHARETAAQRAHIDRLTQENARLQAALTGLARRPERALALVVEGDLAGNLLALINADRVALGRQPLAPDAQLDWVARWRSATMAAEHWYAHVSPTSGESAASVLRAFGGPNSGYVGESIWACSSWQACDSTLVHRTFYESPSHKDNQERPEYTHFGIGVALGPEPDAALYVTEIFSRQPAAEVVRALQGG